MFLTPRTVLIAIVVFWTLVALRLIRSPSNHVSFNYLWLLPLFILGAGVGFWRRDTTPGRVTIVACFFSIILLLLMFFFNVLVPEVVWIRRGMPQRPF
ncbi:MAG: hypothetical protein NZV14_06245 [Bryobacteraceae bacterium]|nr:hypothetical protein [Bryobacteraceae bacterium]MDW8377742.1 hypothetical protein [Bryobacterales bacterium]